jgi:hypothetical protein
MRKPEDSGPFFKDAVVKLQERESGDESINVLLQSRPSGQNSTFFIQVLEVMSI